MKKIYDGFCVKSRIKVYKEEAEYEEVKSTGAAGDRSIESRSM